MNIKLEFRKLINNQPMFFLVEITMTAILFVIFIAIFSNSYGNYTWLESVLLLSTPLMLGVIALSAAANFKSGYGFRLFGMAVGWFFVSAILVSTLFYAATGTQLQERLVFSIGVFPTLIIYWIHTLAWQSWEKKQEIQ